MLDFCIKSSCNATDPFTMPPAKALLKAADQMGLAVILKVPILKSLKEEQHEEPLKILKDTLIRQLKDWITLYKNHPSIILWAFEVPQQAMKPEKFDLFLALVRTAK